MNPILTILLSIVSSVVTTILVLLKTWIGERIKQAVAREYAVQAAVMSSFAEGYRAAHERRLSAIDALWQELLRIRRSTPSLPTILDWLLPEEYNKSGFIQRTMELARSVPDDLGVSLVTDEAERERPFVGESIYALFYAYRAVSGRVSWLVVDGAKKGKVPFWFEDPGVRQLVSSVLDEEENRSFATMQTGKFTWLRSTIEGKMVAEVNRVISGEESGHLSLKRAEQIRQGSDKLRQDIEREERADQHC